MTKKEIIKREGMAGFALGVGLVVAIIMEQVIYEYKNRYPVVYGRYAMSGSLWLLRAAMVLCIIFCLWEMVSLVRWQRFHKEEERWGQRESIPCGVLAPDTLCLMLLLLWLFFLNRFRYFEDEYDVFLIARQLWSQTSMRMQILLSLLFGVMIFQKFWACRLRGELREQCRCRPLLMYREQHCSRLFLMVSYQLLILVLWWFSRGVLYYWFGSFFHAIPVILQLMFLVWILLWAWGDDQIEKRIRCLAEGRETVPTRRFLLGIRQRCTLRYLDKLQEGIELAVEQKMRSERMRTELITNVSHDLKTPITSLINYVELLKRENLTEGNTQEYLEVLERQSGRMKQLVEDLLDLSKISTGNLPMEQTPCELGILLTQAVGEYEERLTARNLTMLVRSPEEPVEILADSRGLWRVMENLLGNIVKYALEGTRVYLNLEIQDREAVLIFRNVSAEELNISAEELMERFVQGDRSRSSEGSGLGLSIAQSLTEQMGGRMEVTVDGDLFKVVVRFPRMEENSFDN